MSALCSIRATSVIVVRRTPSICPNNSWVNGRMSDPVRSCVCSSQRHSHLIAQDRVSLHGRREGHHRDAQKQAGQLDDGLREREARTQDRHSADHAFAADGSDFDRCAILHVLQQRDERAAARKVHVLGAFAQRFENDAPCQLD
jgi:hypothetical protein